MRQAAGHSRPDVDYLVSMGVLEVKASERTERDKNGEESAVRIPTASDKKTSPRTPQGIGKKENARKMTDTPRPSAVEHGEESRENADGEAKKTPDAILQSLSPVQLEILQSIPDDQTISTDALSKLGHPHGEILTALTMLEIMGLVEKLPGAVYRKA